MRQPGKKIEVVVVSNREKQRYIQEHKLINHPLYLNKPSYAPAYVKAKKQGAISEEVKQAMEPKLAKLNQIQQQPMFKDVIQKKDWSLSRTEDGHIMAWLWKEGPFDSSRALCISEAFHLSMQEDKLMFGDIKPYCSRVKDGGFMVMIPHIDIMSSEVIEQAVRYFRNSWAHDSSCEDLYIKGYDSEEQPEISLSSMKELFTRAVETENEKLEKKEKAKKKHASKVKSNKNAVLTTEKGAIFAETRVVENYQNGDPKWHWKILKEYLDFYQILNLEYKENSYIEPYLQKSICNTMFVNYMQSGYCAYMVNLHKKNMSIISDLIDKICKVSPELTRDLPITLRKSEFGEQTSYFIECKLNIEFFEALAGKLQFQRVVSRFQDDTGNNIIRIKLKDIEVATLEEIFSEMYAVKTNIQQQEKTVSHSPQMR